MHQAERVCVLERREPLVDQSDGLIERERSLLVDELRQVSPRNELHGVPLQPRPAADVVNADDARVAQSARELCLASEPLHDRDRKSTRLNSSHSQISYAVFCLKKKKEQ